MTATVGNGGKVLLLRADMDALPMPEESGLPFACPTGKEAHACGHDFHAAMLLTAAKMLKENEAELKGTVKFMFQPAEETFEGSKNMIRTWYPGESESRCGTGLSCISRADAGWNLHV